jgi:hypothetical protein
MAVNHAMPTNAKERLVPLRFALSWLAGPIARRNDGDGYMPRRSQADLSKLQGTPLLLQPPPNLGGRERELFVKFVASLPPKHLAREDLQLVVSYCRCLHQDEIAGAAISGGSRDPFFVTLSSAARRAPTKSASNSLFSVS